MVDPLSALWVLIGAALVFFMQAGFAMVETGLTRAKNAGNIIMKNTMDFVIGSLLYWLVGFGIMFGVNNGFVGIIDIFTGHLTDGKYAEVVPEGIPPEVFFIFQTVFCATAATIVSGAMAERTKFSAYCVYSGVISLVIYPISGHWIWGGGWLAERGFHDFAGSTAVHMVGGIAAVVGAAILGPRIGKYEKDKDGKNVVNAIPGHSLTLAAIGVFILWFAWFGFNGASSVSMTAETAPLVGHIFVTTNLSAVAATLMVMILSWIVYKKPDVSMTLNGALAGLVAITAGCDTVDPWAAIVIGFLAGILVFFGVEFIDKVLKIDDPVGAVAVHCLNGAFGTLFVGLFSNGSNTELDGKSVKGLFVGGGADLLGIQALGVVSVAAWVAVTISITFFVIKHTMGLRASREEEVIGLDITEHGLMSSYADFIPRTHTEKHADIVTEYDDSKPNDVPVVKYNKPTAEDDGLKLTKVVIVTRLERFEILKDALSKIGITGMSVTNIMGCGMQKGSDEYYRGVHVETRLLPKIQVEVVVCKVPVETVIAAAKSALFTGKIGDGKIFVYDVENVVKIRTS
ncbi:MAG: ammonium transporter, partial [Oscillospiraceae bacterium]|nr:ammonium transporter [Oscillospiraceae bacterium]